MPMHEGVKVTGLAIAATFVLVMMQLRSAPDYAVDGGRRLAGTDSEYARALMPLHSILNQTAADTANGMAGTTQLVISTVLVLILGSLAAGAGVGGGGLFVPIYMVLLGAGPKGAVPLSKATILGGAIGNFITLSRARHPKAKEFKQAQRPIIDYESSTFMQSGELLGVVFGVLLNNLLPSIIIVSFLVCILSYNSIRTFKKGFAARKKENAAMAKAVEVAAKATEVAEAEMMQVNVTPISPTILAEEADAPPPAALAEPESPPPSPPASPKVKAQSADDGAWVDHSHHGPPAVRMFGSFVDVGTAPSNGVAPSDPASKGSTTPELEAIYAEESKQFPLWAVRYAPLGPATLTCPPCACLFRTCPESLLRRAHVPSGISLPPHARRL
jgi:hypothetical protein